MAHFELVENMAPNAIIKVIGVGGGGGNAVAHMVSGNVDGVELDRVRAATLVLDEDADWKTISVVARNADSGLPPSADVPLIL